MRKIRLIVVSTAVIIALVIFGFALFVQEPSSVQQSSVPEELPPEEIPPNLLVIPEVPLGTIAIVLACFFALVISQMKPKNKLR